MNATSKSPLLRYRDQMQRNRYVLLRQSSALYKG